MIKVAPLGGVRAALRIAAAAGMPVVVSSAVDSSVGLTAGLALAAALPELPYACGLGTASLLADDVTTDRAATGRRVHRGAARGRPSRIDIERVRADPATTRYWLDRLQRVAGLI